MIREHFKLIFLIIFSVTSNANISIQDESKAQGNSDWWKSAVFYQIYPRSFKDSNNDGIGDLQGIRSKLNHIQESGITAIWLSPIYESPQVDQGYDISNYTEIDRDYGTMQDFDDLLQEAHSLGIKLVMDFVPNHSSDQHEWFIRSEAKEDPYTDYYVWKDGLDNGLPPNNWISLFKNSAWTFNSRRNQYYLHQFAKEQPDLNYNSETLVNEMKGILKFWLDKGIDGFRIDAVPYIYEDDGFQDEPIVSEDIPPNDYEYLNHIYTSDQPKTFDMIYQWRAYLDEYTKLNGGDTRVIMTEAYTDIANTMKYYGDEEKNGAHFTFNFQFITKVANESTAKDTVLAIKEWFAYMPPHCTANWVIGNHDNHRVATRFGPERVDGMNMLAAFLPGVMITYNGEEIGQEDGEVTYAEGQDPKACSAPEEDFDTISRDFERTVYHWNNSTNAGFNDGGPTWLPVSKKYIETNLQAQKIPGISSHYNIYKQILRLRKEPVFINGSLQIFALSDNVLAFTRSIANATYVIVINISDKKENADLSVFEALEKYVKVYITNLSSNKKDRILPIKNITMEPYEAIVAKSEIMVEGNQDWWKNAVFYQIYPRSFKDENNDGIGDLKGITNKLSHLKDAGVTATWLSPIYKSPQVDQGYDISDYLSIEEDYGTMDDFDNLVEKAHGLGIKIIMDFVPNHSSNQHEWFIKSENRTPGYENLYVWKDGLNGSSTNPPNNWLSIFSNSAWKYSDVRKQFYLHQFTVEQPDLNFRDPLLIDKLKEVLIFWLDKGVDGFRMDAVPYLVEDERFLDEPKSNIPGIDPNAHAYLEHIYTADQNDTYNMIYLWREIVEEYTKEHGGDARVLMTEAYTNITNTMKFYGDDTHLGAHFTFNFQFVSYLTKNSTARDIVSLIDEWFYHMPQNRTANWVLGNHDNSRVATKFGPEMVDGMNILTALLPGIMVTYNGEEIGQENGEVTWDQGKDPNACNGNPADFNSTSRDFERTPFQWDTSINAGFNIGAEPWLPVSQKYRQTNLETQSVPGIKSHFHIYQDLVHLRQEPAFKNGSFNISALSNSVLAYTRSSSNGTVYIVVVNVAGTEQNVNVSSFPGVDTYIKVVIANIESNNQGRILSSQNLTLLPYEAFVAKSLPSVEIGDMDWWKHAVFYQIYPRSFKDENNDGIGDLKGITNKLSHLKDAGVTATWLSPIYKSPQVDQGYDISDYLSIDEDYGTMDDFDNLVEKAHSLGIKIIMDFVPNHSSNKHEWFIKSENREPGFDDFYVWKDPSPSGDPPNNWLSSFKYSAWEYNDKRQQYYLHQFAKEQPDLNYSNPAVVQKMKEVLIFWLDRGVDGFRMDAVPTLFEDEQLRDEPPSNKPGVSPVEHAYLDHIYTADMPKTFDMIYQWRTLVDDYVKQHGGDARVLMTEAYSSINNTMKYYGDGERDGAHFTFNFQFINKINISSNATQFVSVINEWLDNMPQNKTANWVIGNHDNHRVATRFGKARVDGMNMLVAILPGVMVTYNGEEIGQEDGEVTWGEGQDPGACNGEEEDFNRTSRDFERTPFQWDNTTNAGFNNGSKPWLPVSSKYKEINLKSQSEESVVSHYQIYKQLIVLRKEDVVQNGTLTIKAATEDLITLRRTSNNSTIVLAFNVGNESVTVNLTSQFDGLTDYLKVIVSSVNSTHCKGDLLTTSQLTIESNDCIIANITSEEPGTNAGSRIISSMVIYIVLLKTLLFL